MLAVIPGGLTKELQPLDLSVNKAFKARLRGRQRRATCATISQWIVDAWADVSYTARYIQPNIKATIYVSDIYIYIYTVVQAFTKAGINTDLPDISSDTDSANDFDETEPGTLAAALAQLFNSDIEEEDFDGFVNEI